MKQEPLLSAFTRLRDNLLSMSRRILQDEDDASDAIQDLCIDRARQKSRFTGYDPDQCDSCDDETAAESETVAERFKAVRQLIDSALTENQRTILEMRDFRGLEIEEIAQELQMQPTAVRMNLSRARKTIREQYKKQYDHDR